MKIEIEEESEKEDEVFDVIALVEKRKKAEQDAIHAKEDALRKVSDEKKREKRKLKEEKRLKEEQERQEDKIIRNVLKEIVIDKSRKIIENL